MLHQVSQPLGTPLRNTQVQDHGLAEKLDIELIRLAQPALTSSERVVETVTVRNTDRTVGTMLGNRVTLTTNGAGLEPGTIDFTLTGTAGQSFGAFIPRGVTLRLVGDSNDYVAKGLSGGTVIVRPPAKKGYVANQEIIAGNVIGYGATSGELYLCGVVGERFCVRNSGATAVAEGVGDHGCEYMTGGEVMVLGPTGRNFAAGMSGGVAWLLDAIESRVNTELADLHPAAPDEVEHLREILTAHAAATDSAVAKELLEASDFELQVRFTKVLPRDYARVLKVQADSLQLGLSEADMTARMMEAAHG